MTTSDRPRFESLSTRLHVVAPERGPAAAR
jgi:hypothetical protein